ncbi:hypothetical protein [Neolewinella antarctica]|uniref:Cold shock CspA family protein n=1 Tax=Neolewinella antarctica TaxID=442734 RepID=A0ABX0X928_9BACT|nr:hypothetical protein [Neolewinella antarctica]NJC25771.1 cold shock CspA family protein [Neolewinella antarctica]
MTTLSFGTILFYLEDRNHGYVRLQDTREEFHFRVKNLRYPDPKAGDLVKFRIKRTGQGYVADRIEKAGLA